MQRNGKEQLESGKKSPSRNKSYSPPRLRVHGDAQVITKGISGLATDGQAGSQPFDEQA